MQELIDAVRMMFDSYDNGRAPSQYEFDELRELCDTAENELRELRDTAENELS